MWCRIAWLSYFFSCRIYHDFPLKFVSTPCFILIITAFPSPLCEHPVTRATQTGRLLQYMYTIYHASHLTARRTNTVFPEPILIYARFNLVVFLPHTKENIELDRFLGVITTTWMSISEFPSWIIDFLYYAEGNCYFGFMLIKESDLPSPQDGTEKWNRVISKDCVCSALLRVALCVGAWEADEPGGDGDYSDC